MEIPKNCKPHWVLQPIKYANEDLKNNEDFHFWCPGCDERHVIRKTGKDGQAEWSFNDNLVTPTFFPSYLVGGKDAQGRKFMKRRCHSYITEGCIKFLDDCHHKLKGQAIRLPPLKDWRY